MLEPPCCILEPLRFLVAWQGAPPSRDTPPRAWYARAALDSSRILLTLPAPVVSTLEACLAPCLQMKRARFELAVQASRQSCTRAPRVSAYAGSVRLMRDGVELCRVLPDTLLHLLHADGALRPVPQHPLEAQPAVRSKVLRRQRTRTLEVSPSLISDLSVSRPSFAAVGVARKAARKCCGRVENLPRPRDRIQCIRVRGGAFAYKSSDSVR